MLPFLLIFAVSIGFTESRVDFTHSVLLDQYDVFNLDVGTQYFYECKSGCSIYASIPPDATDALREARNVVISNLETRTTLFDIAALFDPATSQKLPYIFEAKQRPISIWYNGKVAGAGPALLYIFSDTGKSNVPFEVYEARTMSRAAAPASIITILSPEPFNVGVEAMELGNTVYAYSAGMDNALEGGPDACTKVFELRDQQSFPGFVLNAQLPLLSFFFNMDTPVKMYTQMVYDTVTGFQPFLTSPGFVGCYGMQVYRSSLYADSVEQTVSSEKIEHVTIDATLYNEETYPVKITDATNNKEYDLWGDDTHHNAQQSLTVDSKLLYISWKKQWARSAFLLRFATSDAQQPNRQSTSRQSTISPTSPTTSGQVGKTMDVIIPLVALLLLC